MSMKVIDTDKVRKMLIESGMGEADREVVVDLIDRFGIEVAALMTETLDAAPSVTYLSVMSLMAMALTTMGKKSRELAIKTCIEVLGGDPDAQG